jgi:hypothetical protein
VSTNKLGKGKLLGKKGLFTFVKNEKRKQRYSEHFLGATSILLTKRNKKSVRTLKQDATHSRKIGETTTQFKINLLIEICAKKKNT